MTKSIQLKVAEALQIDYGKRVVRINSSSRESLGITTGDIVEIKAKKNTAAIVLPAHPQDEELGIIRMDGILRQNAGVGLGDRVHIKKAEVREAAKIVLAPNQASRYAPGFDSYVKKALLGKPLVKGDVQPINVFGTTFPFAIAQTNPNGIVQVTHDTELVLKEEPVKELGRISTIRYEDIGGLKEEVQKVREMVELPLRHPELFEALGIDPPKGVLLYGTPGGGKTLLAKAVANESEAHFITINGPEIVSKFVGEAEERLREIFTQAEENAPTIVFIDEIDAIAPKREEVTGEVEKRIVSQLLTLMDGLKSRGKVIVMAATNRPNSLDPALRRPGRFDREIEIGVPDKTARKEILQIHTRGMPLDVSHRLEDAERSLKDSKDKDEKSRSEKVADKARLMFLGDIADKTHGFVGADLQALCRESAMKVLRRILPKINLEDEIIPQKILDEIRVTKDDFEAALREVRPSALREVAIEMPNVKWSEIGGLEEPKKQLKEAVELPLKDPDAFTRLGIRPVKGILLYGPPGTGKTLLAKAVATESEANFIAIRGPELINKWVGETEKGIREIFRKARSAAPSIIFFDEVEALAASRTDEEGGYSRVSSGAVNTLLAEMDGLQELKGVVVIAATNRPDIIDFALMRPGRFDKRISIPLPDEQTREAILTVHTRKMPFSHTVPAEEREKLFKAKLPKVAEKDREKLVKVSKDYTEKELGEFAAEVLKLSAKLSFEQAVETAQATAKPSGAALRQEVIRYVAANTGKKPSDPLSKDYSGADLEDVCREAGMDALRSNQKIVTLENFKKALGVMSSVSLPERTQGRTGYA